MRDPVMACRQISRMRTDDLPTDFLFPGSNDDSPGLSGSEFEELKWQLQQCDLSFDQDREILSLGKCATPDNVSQIIPLDEALNPTSTSDILNLLEEHFVKNGTTDSMMTPPRGKSPVTVESSDSQCKKPKLPRHKRESHINAEQRRRCKIQKGFDELHNLVPAISEIGNNGTKDSKSAMLNKSLDYVRQIRSENSQLKKEIEDMKAEAEQLNAEINTYQQTLPESGVDLVPVQPESETNMKQLFEDFIRARTMQNWKFWLFGLIIRPLFESYQQVVETDHVDRFCSTCMKWVESCNLLSLRSVGLKALRQLSSKTSILEKPSSLPEEVIHRAIGCDPLPGLS